MQQRSSLGGPPTMLEVARPNIVNDFNDDLKRAGFKSHKLSPAASLIFRGSRVKRHVGEAYAYLLSSVLGFVLRRVENHNLRTMNFSMDTMRKVLASEPGLEELMIGPINVYVDGGGFSIQYYPRPRAKSPEWVEEMLRNGIDDSVVHDARYDVIEPPVESEGGHV